jgi:hypothetical protein
VFLTKEEGMYDICSTAYLKQVLKRVVFLYYDLLDEDEKEEFIFIEDSSKVHKEKARLPKLEKEIRGFDWLPFSPDLNPIEKVWHWMKNEITKLANPPTTIEEMKRVLQELWDKVEPKD